MDTRGAVLLLTVLVIGIVVVYWAFSGKISFLNEYITKTSLGRAVSGALNIIPRVETVDYPTGVVLAVTVHHNPETGQVEEYNLQKVALSCLKGGNCRFWFTLRPTGRLFRHHQVEYNEARLIVDGRTVEKRKILGKYCSQDYCTYWVFFHHRKGRVELSGPGGVLYLDISAPERRWEYNKVLTIRNRSDEALFLVQVPVEINNDVVSKSATDGVDIRFTTEDGMPIPYYIEMWDKKDGKARIWIRIPYLPAKGEKKIILWYGGPREDASSPETVFLFFERFPKSGGDWKATDEQGVREEGNALEIDRGSVILSGTISRMFSPVPQRVIESEVEWTPGRREPSGLTLSDENKVPDGGADYVAIVERGGKILAITTCLEGNVELGEARAGERYIIGISLSRDTDNVEVFVEDPRTGERHERLLRCIGFSRKDLHLFLGSYRGLASDGDEIEKMKVFWVRMRWLLGDRVLVSG